MPRKKKASKKQIEQEYQSLKTRLEHSSLRAEDTEYERAKKAAHEAGFKGQTVNGRPRVVGSIISVTELLG